MRTPRLLPMIGIAVGGVLAIKALSGGAAFPELFQGAKAFAEGSIPGKTIAPAMPGDLKAGDPKAGAPKASAPPLPPGLSLGQPGAVGPLASAAPAPLACGPDAADLARQAGLSPAELQILQSLQNRRGQLDTREQDMDAQMQLLAAAEAKIDAKLAALNNLKTDLKGIIGQADQERDAELARLVIVYSQMKPKDAAARMAVLDDSVRLPIAAKMKERALSAMLAQMSPPEAKRLTEALAARFAASQAVANGRAAIAQSTAPAQTAPTHTASTQTGAAAPTTSPAKPPAAAAPTRTAEAAATVPEKPAARSPATRRRPHRTAQATRAATKPADGAAAAAKPVSTAEAAAPGGKPGASTPTPAPAKPVAPAPTAAPAAAKPG